MEPLTSDNTTSINFIDLWRSIVLVCNGTCFLSLLKWIEFDLILLQYIKLRMFSDQVAHILFINWQKGYIFNTYRNNIFKLGME